MAAETSPTTSQLRLAAGVNHFKHQLLGREHVANSPQAAQVMARVPKGYGVRGVDARTWSSWFSDSPPRPRPSAVDCLDLWATKKGFDRVAGFRDDGHFYRELISQGLAHALLSPTASQNPEMALRVRAAEYMPASALHLHLDALEISGLMCRNGAVQSETLKEIGAERIMQLLHDRWNVRSGWIFPTLSSDLSLHLSQVSEEEGAEVRRVLERFTPSAFPILLNKTPLPVFCAFADQRDLAPSQVHQTLLSVAGDSQFLQGDRMNAWCIDLASSCLALHALAWAKQPVRTAHLIESEMIYLAALEALLFVELDENELGELIGQVNVVGHFDWSADVFDTLVRAREHYHVRLQTYGLTAGRVWAGAKRSESTQSALNNSVFS